MPLNIFSIVLKVKTLPNKCGGSAFPARNAKHVHTPKLLSSAVINGKTIYTLMQVLLEVFPDNFSNCRHQQVGEDINSKGRRTGGG